MAKTLLSLLLLLVLLSEVAFAKVDPEKIKDIALVIASEKGFLGVSSFGHAFLRLMKRKGFPAGDDLVVEVAAINEGDGFSLFRGLGINPYPARMNLIPYSYMADIKLRTELRSLTSYTLNLTNLEIQKLVSEVNLLSTLQETKGSIGEYGFFSNNCATYTLEILNKALDQPVEGLLSMIPTQIPGLLQEQGLVAKTVTDENAGISRAVLVGNLRKTLDLENSSIMIRNIQKQLLSEDPSDRELAYLKLTYLAAKETRPENRKKWLTMVRKFVFTEPGLQRVKLLEHIQSVESQQESRIVFVPVDSSRLVFSDKVTVENLSLAYDGGIAGIHLELNKDDRESPERGPLEIHLQFPVPELHYESNEGVFYYGKMAVAYQLSNGFSHPYLTLTYEDVELDRGTHQIIPYFVVEFPRQMNEDAQLEKADLLPFSNLMLNACATMAKLVEAFYEQAAFIPDMPRLQNEEEYFSLIEKMRSGHYIVVPGYHNVEELISSLNPQKMREFIKKMDQEYDKVSTSLKLFFNSQPLNSQNIADIRQLKKLGLLTPITFQKEKSTVGHMVMAYDLNESNTEYILDVYDPNFGLAKIHLAKASMKITDSVYADTFNLRMENVEIVKEQTRKLTLKNVDPTTWQFLVSQAGRYDFGFEEIPMF